MAKIIYGQSEHCSDLLYATRFFIPDPIIWFSIDDAPYIIVNSMEYNRAKTEAKKEIIVLSYGEAKKKFRLKNLQIESQILGISRYFGIKKWLVPNYFPYSLVESLSRTKLKFKSVKNAFFPERECKGNDEIEKIREGVRLAESGLSCALELLRNSEIKRKQVFLNGKVLTSEFLKGEINAEISRNGGVASHTIVACGRLAADPHCTGSGPIYANEPIIIDIFPRVNSTGYFGDLTRTVVKGRASEVVGQAFNAVHKACQYAIKNVQSKIDAKDIHKSVHKILKNSGFKTDIRGRKPCGFIHGTGHGLGLEIHESPRIGTLKSILRKNHVVTIEPGLYYPEWGGVRIEDVVVIQKKGCRNLTTALVELEIP